MHVPYTRSKDEVDLPRSKLVQMLQELQIDWKISAAAANFAELASPIKSPILFQVLAGMRKGRPLIPSGLISAKVRSRGSAERWGKKYSRSRAASQACVIRNVMQSSPS